MINTKKIIKNSLFLYTRMFFLLVLTLYTSRLILNTLGITDFGIFNLIVGVISMLAFLNASISLGIQRYLSIDIANCNNQKLKQTFSTSIFIQIIIALIVLIIAETVGLWYINYQMQFPIDRLLTVNIIYQLTVITFILNVLQIPYVSLLLAKEAMSAYSSITVFDSLLKFLAAILLPIIFLDKLIVYVSLLTLTSLITFSIYKFFCNRKYPESHVEKLQNFIYLKEIMLFSGWSIIGNLAYILRMQGTGVILNLFFGNTINASYGLALQVFSAASLFVSNLQLAINPQIMQNYAKNEKNQSINLALMGSKYSFFLVLLLSLPIIINTDIILKLWLGFVPNFTSEFTNLFLLMILVDAISLPLMTLIAATGKIKTYHIILGSLNLLLLPISFISLNLNKNPTVIFYAIISFSVMSLIIRLVFLKKLVNLDLSDFFQYVLLKLIAVITSLILIFYFFIDYLKAESWSMLIINSSIICTITLLIIILLGTSSAEKKLICDKIKL